MVESMRGRHRRPRLQTSCAVCHRRKVKCNNRQPCDQCIKHRCPDECHFNGVSPVHVPPTPVLHSPAGAPQSIDSTREYGSPSTSALLGRLSSTPARGFHGFAEPSESRQSEPSSIVPGAHDESTSRYRTHDWGVGSPTRGRTHSSWTLHLFEPIVARADEADFLNGQVHENGTSTSTESINASYQNQNDLSSNRPLSGAIHDDLPSDAIIRELVARYFDTFNTVYCLIDQGVFEQQFAVLLNNRSVAPVASMIQLLLMLALANTTYPLESAPLATETTIGWLSLASTLPTSTLEVDELKVETVRSIALLNLSKQIIMFNETADCVYSAAGVRCAMLLGLHRLTPDELSSPLARINQQLWVAIRDLELHACVAGGVPPTAPYGIDQEWSSDSNTGTTGYEGLQTATSHSASSLGNVFARSLAVRWKIVTVLNTEKHLHFEQVVKLSRDLSRTMAPVSGAVYDDPSKWTFQYRFALSVYRKFLLALHRPFAVGNDPAFYLSRSICTQHSQIVLREVCQAFRQDSTTDLYSPLLAGNGTIIRTDAFQAVLYLAYEFYRQNDASDLQSMLYLPNDNRQAIRVLLEESMVMQDHLFNTKKLRKKIDLILSYINLRGRFG